MSTALVTTTGTEITLRDGSTVQLPGGEFPPPSARVLAMAMTNQRLAALHYAREAFVADADGVQLKLSPFAAQDWLASGGPFVSGPTITERTANVDSYLRARTVFDHPELYAPERGTGTCDCCGKRGTGWIRLAPDAMLTPSEVGFIGDCCHRD